MTRARPAALRMAILGAVGVGIAAAQPASAQPAAPAPTQAQEDAQWNRYEELLRLWEESRRLDADHNRAAKRCDRQRMAAVRAELDSRYTQAQAIVQTMAYVQQQTGASGVPDGFHPPRYILDQMLALMDAATRRRPDCGGAQPKDDRPQVTTGGESAGEAMPPPETQSPPPPPRAGDSPFPRRSPSAAENAEERARSAYNRAIDAAYNCDKAAFDAAIAELEELLRVIDSELAILRDPVRRWERLKNTPAAIEHLAAQRSETQGMLEAARRFKLRCQAKQETQQQSTMPGTGETTPAAPPPEPMPVEEKGGSADVPKTIAPVPRSTSFVLPTRPLPGTYRISGPVTSTAPLTIVQSGSQLMLMGAGEPIPLEQNGDTYVGTGATLMGKSNLQVELRMVGGIPQLTTTDAQGVKQTAALAAMK